MRLDIVASMIVLAFQVMGVISASLFAASENSIIFQNPFSNDDRTVAGKPVPGDSPVELCDIYSRKLLTIDHINISPNPPVKGQNLTIEATGTLAVDVEEGAYVNVEVTYGFVRLLTQTFDLCEQSEQVDMTCPIKKGPISINKEIQLPDGFPPGKYYVLARAYTKNDRLITCLEARATFSTSFGSFLKSFF